MESDSFIGIKIGGYTIKEQIGKGCIGRVFRAYNKNYGNRAIKLVPYENVSKKPTWKQEITKVTRLENTEGVVRFHNQGYKTIAGKKYIYMMWDYIEGETLKSIIDNKKVTIQMIVDIIEGTLGVFHACNALNIQHSDFHSGNIIIENPDPRNINVNHRRVFITDFGYGIISPDVVSEEIMDDYKGFARIIQECISSIDMHTLEKEDRKKYLVLKSQFPKLLYENNRTEGEYVRNPYQLRQELYNLFNKTDNTQHRQKSIGDYLVAEYLGDRYDDWDSLYAPVFLAKEDLFDRNICVLTGIRGCGKTTIFMRVSYDLKNKLGKAGIQGEDGFIGFYLNARTIVEAFPWLPSEKYDDARKQVINYFNLKWTIQILEWLRSEADKYKDLDYSWVCSFFMSYLEDCSFTSTSNIGIINTAISGCESALLRCKLGERYMPDVPWAFSDYDYLEIFVKTIKNNCFFANQKDFFLFFDDYSSPMISECTQKILNWIIFRRTSSVFFKVSTESIESFIKLGPNDKHLEENNDYKVIDLGVKSILNKDVNKDIISAIFDRRIKRSDIFAKYDTNLDELLGNNNIKNTERAQTIRDNESKNLYYGTGVFYDIWSSDIRELIKIFSSMVSAQCEAGDIDKRIEYVRLNKVNTPDNPVIQQKTQDKMFRFAGGSYLNLLKTVMNPCNNHGHKTETKNKDIIEETYGEHLFKISSALHQILSYDLKNKTSKNQEQSPPKQARRIEISDGSIFGRLTPVAECYFSGLVRYGFFVNDPRGKSVRGSVATRLYLRSMLIPFFNITFSKRDSITLTCDEFNELLMMPDNFVNTYKKKGDNFEQQKLFGEWSE
ncbi:MAG: hypothetical protein WC152_07730 [Candidatus Izemoplasmatales bacterium]